MKIKSLPKPVESMVAVRGPESLQKILGPFDQSRLINSSKPYALALMPRFAVQELTDDFMPILTRMHNDGRAYNLREIGSFEPRKTRRKPQVPEAFLDYKPEHGLQFFNINGATSRLCRGCSPDPDELLAAAELVDPTPLILTPTYGSLDLPGMPRSGFSWDMNLPNIDELFDQLTTRFGTKPVRDSYLRDLGVEIYRKRGGRV